MKWTSKRGRLALCCSMDCLVRCSCACYSKLKDGILLVLVGTGYQFDRLGTNHVHLFF